VWIHNLTIATNSLTPNYGLVMWFFVLVVVVTWLKFQAFCKVWHRPIQRHKRKSCWHQSSLNSDWIWTNFGGTHTISKCFHFGSGSDCYQNIWLSIRPKWIGIVRTHSKNLTQEFISSWLGCYKTTLWMIIRPLIWHIIASWGTLNHHISIQLCIAIIY
jgi:hypothetical protein